MNPLTERVVDWFLPIGLIALALGAIFAVYEFFKPRVVTREAEELPDAEALGLGESLEAVAKIGDVLNKATVSVRFFVVGILLLVLTAIAAGADAIGTDSPPASSNSSQDADSSEP